MELNGSARAPLLILAPISTLNSGRRVRFTRSTRKWQPVNSRALLERFFPKVPARSSGNNKNMTNIGTTDRPLMISRMGCGTWNWGNQLLWDYSEESDVALEEVFNTCLDNGVNLFDTGDSYGTGKLEGRAEQLLGEFSQRRGITGKEVPNKICVGTKLAAYPWRLTPGSMVDAIRASAQRLQRDDGTLELGQMHWAPSSYGFGFQEDALLAGLCEAYEEGIISGVGLSNFGPKSLRKVHRRLEARGVPIATLQTQFSLLSYLKYQRETKEVCDELGITLISYSPLCLGLLSGKYTSEGAGVYPSGPRGLLARKILPSAESSGLLPTLTEIAAQRSTSKQQVTNSQVALAWCMHHGTVPIPGAKSKEQCLQNLGAMKLSLSGAEVDALDEAAMSIKASKAMVQNSMRSM